MEYLCGESEETRKNVDIKIRETIEYSENLEFYPSRAVFKKKYCWEIQPHYEFTEVILKYFLPG